MPGNFGEIPGVPVGTLFPDRAALSRAGVHRPTQAGISGNPGDGADSIVLSGGYEDDLDLGDVVIYTGHGGNDRETGKQVADQELTRQNLALAVSCQQGLPVRVVRGARHRSEHSPPVGYRYDGLYRVESYWAERGRSGFRIWRFRLERLAGTPAITAPADGDAAPRRGMTIQRVVRSSAVAQRVKELHDHRCQVCGVRLEAAAGPYSEAAHVRPLGRPHDGPDATGNVLCLCPNHHALLDFGAIVVAEDFGVFDAITGRTMGALRRHPAHQVDPAALAYHRGLHASRAEGSVAMPDGAPEGSA